MPPNSADEVFEELLRDLPEAYQDMAREFKAFTRPRKIASPQDLMQLVLMYSGVDKTLRDVAGNFTLLKGRITDSAVQKRLSACVPWLKAVLQKMWPDLGKLPGHIRLVVVDGSSVSVPGAVGTSYRLHLAMDLIALSFVHVEVTDAHVGESLSLYSLGKGDIVLVDRGYNHPETIFDQTAQGVSLVLRLSPHAMPLVKPGTGEKIDLYETLKRSPVDELCIPVWLSCKKRGHVKAWVHARRLPPDKREAARRKCRAGSKNGKPKRETLFFAEWLLVFTTVPPDVLDTQPLCSLYGLRWQVELIFKRLKSLLAIDQLRAKEGSSLNEVWLYGKLLFATLLVKRAHRDFESCGLESDIPRAATPWRLWKLLKDEVTEMIICALHWRPSQRKAALKVIKERPRKRKLQSLPLAVVRFLRDCTQLAPQYAC